MTKVPVGPSSLIGWLASAGALLVCIVQSINEAQPLLTHGNKTSGLIAAAILIFTHAGRQYQAANLPGAQEVGEAVDELPPALADLAQSGLQLVASNPDGVDGPHVADSGAPAAAAPAPATPPAA